MNQSFAAWVSAAGNGDQPGAAATHRSAAVDARLVWAGGELQISKVPCCKLQGTRSKNNFLVDKHALLEFNLATNLAYF